MTKRVIRILIMFLIATMMLMPACGPTQYTLTTSVSPSGGGTVTPSSGTYDEGTEVNLAAEPASGYRFDRWSGDATSTSNSVNVTMDTNKAVTAHFMAQYTLTTSVSPSGGGTIIPVGGTYDASAELALTATPAEGYIFDYWSGDATDTSSPVTITMESNKSITAHFKAVFVSDDGRIGFVLDKIERTQTWPDDIKYGRSPEAGHDFAIVHVTIAFIQEGHIGATRGSILVGNNGARYQEIVWAWQGIKCNDPHDIKSCGELAEGAIGRLLFELPVAVEVEKLELAYEFFWDWSKTWEPISPELKHIDINLK